ncbi:LysR family transcriptional regulator [Shewanella surugensis]|uniref:LysR substrate-binding domain-containing protein n=1 Tax=Shewanella surugensis TaxID=212020 RepID=A0ABT0LC84_9GAMM|nr:LysR family transcriptional regulator [Shewanella surugensis]MCL1125115.1 LysR substrate-binding domain-containing protein [Shewanella surugensis]
MLIEDLQVILKVAEFRSITAAAANLDMRTATASVAIKRVEKALGAELFIRTTRHLRLSNAGERYLPQCQQALNMLEQAKLNMKDDLDIIDGELRIALSSDLGRNIVLPWIDDFMMTYPNISLRANISDSNIDFYRDSVDMALRYGSPNDANLYGFKICNVPRILCASQAYLDENGTPKHPHDLASHNGLFYQLQDIIKDVWDFSHRETSHQEKGFKIKMNGQHASNDGDLVRRWCVASKGIAIKSCLDMSNDLLSGKVVNILPEFSPTPTELWLIFPSRQSITPAARLLRDTCREKSSHILQQLIKKGILDDSVLT